MARKFFYVCAGMFLLALSYHFGASTAGAQGSAKSSGFASPSEVAVLQGASRNGDTIPLPTYADGTPALESECAWVVSIAHAEEYSFAADALYNVNELPACCFGPDFLTSHKGRIVNVGKLIGQVNGGAVANYLIIATRGASLPTTALHESWGQLKARYRTTPGMTVTPGADDK